MHELDLIQWGYGDRIAAVSPNEDVQEATRHLASPTVSGKDNNKILRAGVRGWRINMLAPYIIQNNTNTPSTKAVSHLSTSSDDAFPFPNHRHNRTQRHIVEEIFEEVLRRVHNISM